jgi:dCMP deaminase
LQGRKEWDRYFLDMALAASARSTCLRRHVGAVVVDRRSRVRGVGFNGAPSGLPHCNEVGCLMQDGHCVRAIHAEINALLECVPGERVGATLYCTDYPCDDCAKVILNTGIRRVVFARPYEVADDWLAGRLELVQLPLAPAAEPDGAD